MSKITVIDAPCGVGKTHNIIQQMNQNVWLENYLYISPLREIYPRLDGKDEYEGKGTAVYYAVPSPKNCEGNRIHGIKFLMNAKRDIKSTHALFMRFDEECVEIASSNHYHLVIDEDINVVAVLSKEDGIKKTSYDENDDSEDQSWLKLKKNINYETIAWLCKKGLAKIEKDNFNQVIWTGGDEAAPRYEDVQQLLKTGAVSMVNDKFVIWSFPISIIDAFENITILTYRWNSSILKHYLDFYDRSYEHLSLVRDENGDHKLIPHNPVYDGGKKWAGLIHICESPKLNAIGERTSNKGSYPLSATWYSKATKEQKTVLRNNQYTFFYNMMHANRNKVMWTVYKSYIKDVKRNFQERDKDDWEVNDAGEKVAKGTWKKDKKTGEDIFKPDKIKTWVPWNCKATEKHKDCNILSYLVDIHLNPGIKNFLALRDIMIDENEYALSELIQWIFRSAVRNGEEINLYIPSTRMRRLLKEWLEN